MIAVLDYDAGNLTSVACAVRHLGHEPEITRDPEVVRSADRVIFPGVGAAGSSMATLEKLGLAAALRDAHSAGKPILGICIGCQGGFSSSEEGATSWASISTSSGMVETCDVDCSKELLLKDPEEAQSNHLKDS